MPPRPDPPVTPTLAARLRRVLTRNDLKMDDAESVECAIDYLAALTPEPVTPPASTPPDDATLIRAALAGDYAEIGTTLPGVSPADRWLDHHTRTIGPAQQAWAAQAQANRCEAMRRVLAGDPRDPQAIADEIAQRVSWTGVGTP